MANCTDYDLWMYFYIYFSFLRYRYLICIFSPVGSVSEDVFVLVCPTLHSVDRVYGVTDFGYQGIRSFFSTHKCNSLCFNWLKPKDLMLDGNCCVATESTMMAKPKSKQVRLNNNNYSRSRSPRRSSQSSNKLDCLREDDGIED